MPRSLHTFAAAALLAVLFSACQMEMGIGAKLNRDGSGTFTMAVAVDKEFIDGIGEMNRRTGGATGIAGVQGFDEFFNSLKKQGWRMNKTTSAAGDVAFNAQCDFPNSAGFDTCVKELSTADGGGTDVSFGSSGLAFDFGTEGGFFKTKTFFTGSADLSGSPGERGASMTRAIQALADEYFTFEIRAELPGSVRITSGGGAVRNGVAVWEPRVGEKLTFGAEADAINPLSLVAVALPALGLLGWGAWGLMRRRGPRDDGGGFVAPSVESVSPQEEVTS